VDLGSSDFLPEQKRKACLNITSLLTTIHLQL
jgi:hypothetical protein